MHFMTLLYKLQMTMAYNEKVFHLGRRRVYPIIIIYTGD